MKRIHIWMRTNESSMESYHYRPIKWLWKRATWSWLFRGWCCLWTYSCARLTTWKPKDQKRQGEMKMRGIMLKPFLHASELHDEELFMRKALLSYERISEPPVIFDSNHVVGNIQLFVRMHYIFIFCIVPQRNSCIVYNSTIYKMAVDTAFIP